MHGGEGRTNVRGPYISSFAAPLATRTIPESALRTPHGVVLALVTLSAVIACDRLGEIVLVPEAELVDSFESGTGSKDPAP